jgi:folate-binding protein YgfZ
MTMTTPDESFPRQTIALADRSPNRVRLRITGPDRAKFLHNLTTQNIKALTPGQGAEAFVTNLQGRTLAFASVLATDDALILRTDAPSLDPLTGHFGKYSLFDDVAWTDESSASFEWHLFGEEDLNPLSTSLAPDVLVIPERWTPFPGLTLIGPESQTATVRQQLESSGIQPIAPETFDVLRIAAGTPISGLDVTPENLPQEVGRDASAISFNKGCYLGQETVARLDALGHVNKLLRGLIFDEASQPTPGQPLVAPNGKPAGSITTCAFSPERHRWIGLGYVRVAHPPGTDLRLGTADGPIIQVSDWPIP